MAAMRRITALGPGKSAFHIQNGRLQIGRSDGSPRPGKAGPICVIGLDMAYGLSASRGVIVRDQMRTWNGNFLAELKRRHIYRVAARLAPSVSRYHRCRFRVQ